MKPQQTETTYVLINCPVCSCNVNAVVTAKITIGKGAYDPVSNTLDFPVAAKPTSFNVHHVCAGAAELDDGGESS